MEKTIYNKFDKSEITQLPVVSFPGRIIVVLSEAEADKAVDYLLSRPLLGLDTETRPAFRKGQNYKVSLLQVSTEDTCFLFRLNHIGLPDSVLRLLTDTKVTKVGLSWHDDLCMLRRRREFTPGQFVDIQNLTGQLGIEDQSLQKLYANLFHEKISKGQRLSNWEIETLKDAQLMYAATDAWTCINLYEEICRLEQTKDYLLVAEEEPEAAPEPAPDALSEPTQTPESAKASDAVSEKAPKKARRRHK